MRVAFVNYVVYVLARLALCVAQAVRIETCERIANWTAWLCYDGLRIRRSIVDDNLQQAFPEKSVDERNSIGRGMWRHIVLMICELAHVPRKVHETNWREYINVTGNEQVKHLLSPRPTILVSGHYGNFEVGGVVAGLFGFPTYTVARPLDNPLLDNFLQRHRGARGQYMLPKVGSAKQIDAVLESGGTLVLLGDQHAGPKGCWVDFFGRPASSHKAVAVFCLAHDAPMVVTYTRRVGTTPMKFELGVAGIYDPKNDESMNVSELTQWYSSRLEEVVREAPEQYWWLHRRWKEPPRRRRGRARRDRASQNRPHITSQTNALQHD